MFNRPTISWSETSSDGQRRWDFDENPQSRIVLLWIGLLVPILVIGVRVAHLQLVLKDEFAQAFSLKAETLEEIPARDGRILASDGTTVLAGDIQRFDVAVYYPAIQNPPDDSWITAKAKPRLSKIERRDKKKVAAEKQKVIEENEELWMKLAALTNRPVNEVLDSRAREQERIERIKRAVQRRYRERHDEINAESAHEIAASQSTWMAIWKRFQQVMSERTEPNNGPRLLTEELEYCSVISDITADMKLEIETHPEKYPYTRVLIQTRRTYPQHEFASHLIGARKPFSEEDFQKRKKAYPNGDPQDYRVGDPYGLSGLERTYDVVLKGVRGQRSLLKNRRGEIVEEKIVREPRHGRDVRLTLDFDIQNASEQILDKALCVVTKGSVDLEATHVAHAEPTCPQGGCIVALDVHTGAVIAAATAPRFDANLYIAPDPEVWDDVMSDKRSPLFSRVTDMALPPGSVFKVISAIASIESGKMPAHEIFHCRGYLDRPEEYHRCFTFLHQRVGHSDVTLSDALCRSCNVYFYTAARRMGPLPIVDWARRFGIGQPTGIDLPSESSGHLPAPDSSISPTDRRRSWKPSKTLDLAIGQSDLTVTPLQMARVIAAVANDGYLVTPHLLASAGPTSINENDSIRHLLPEKESRPISGLHSDTLDHVREGMTMVVHDPRGTGYKYVRLKEVTIAGKTGTAQTNGVDHAWFAGYVPAERPRIAFVVVLEHGGGGGRAAGPVAKEFVKTLLDKGLILKTNELADERSRNSVSAKR